MKSPEERAQKVVTEWLNTYGAMYHDLVIMIAAAIAEAEAAAIRARGSGEADNTD